MKLLTQNIINIFGEEGKNWLANLPIIIAELIDHWELKQVTPVDNMTFNYVAKAITSTQQSVVLKISCDKKSISEERQALNYFNGKGSIQLISHHAQYQALLLQQAIPGTTLKTLYSSQIEYAMDCYIDTMKKLHSKPLTNKNHYPHIKDWLSVIENLSDEHCPPYLIKKAIVLKNTLLASMKTEIFIHGDLHHDNILQHEKIWLAIDPKGVIGDPEFEIAAFDFLYIHELTNQHNAKTAFEKKNRSACSKIWSRRTTH